MKVPHTLAQQVMGMHADLEQTCDDYRRYLSAILTPAMAQLQSGIDDGRVALHQVFGANLFLAHAVDYIQAIRKVDGRKETRIEFVRKFDELYSVSGARISNRKFELIDAINNALKHVRLAPGRYKELESRYGPISFQSLVEENGRVLCILEDYRFDFARVVLRPAYRALAGWVFEDSTEVLEFARGHRTESSSLPDAFLDSAYSVGLDDWDDPIDQMIDYCNPACEDCGEGEADCHCAQYVYDGQQGHFEPRFNSSFDFDGVMSQISGAYRKERD